MNTFLSANPPLTVDMSSDMSALGRWTWSGGRFGGDLLGQDRALYSVVLVDAVVEADDIGTASILRRGLTVKEKGLKNNM